jgi:hypothetical protein
MKIGKIGVNFSLLVMDVFKAANVVAVAKDVDVVGFIDVDCYQQLVTRG